MYPIITVGIDLKLCFVLLIGIYEKAKRNPKFKLFHCNSPAKTSYQPADNEGKPEFLALIMCLVG